MTALGCATIQIDARGMATLEIEDAEGEIHSYSVTPAPEGLDQWACTICRLDGEGEGPYRVAQEPGGRWVCNCPSHRYKKGPHAPRGCKHTAAVKLLFTFARSLVP